MKNIFKILYLYLLIIASIILFSRCASITPIIEDTCNIAADICGVAQNACINPPGGIQEICNIATDICSYSAGICSLINSKDYSEDQLKNINDVLLSVKNNLNGNNKSNSLDTWNIQKHILEKLYNDLK